MVLRGEILKWNLVNGHKGVEGLSSLPHIPVSHFSAGSPYIEGKTEHLVSIWGQIILLWCGYWVVVEIFSRASVLSAPKVKRAPPTPQTGRASGLHHRPCSASPMGAHLNSDRNAWPRWHPFYTPLLPIDPIVCSALTQWPPFMHQFCDNLSSNDPLFDILSKFSFISTFSFHKCVQVCILPERLAKICIILTLWPPLLKVFSLNDPFFEKNLSPKGP